MRLAAVVFDPVALYGVHQRDVARILRPVAAPAYVFPPNVCSEGPLFLHILLILGDHGVLLRHLFAGLLPQLKGKVFLVFLVRFVWIRASHQRIVLQPVVGARHLREKGVPIVGVLFPACVS